MGFKLRASAWVALLATAAPVSSAFAGGVFFGLGGGSGDVTFDDDFAANIGISDDNFVGEWAVGYRFDSNVVIEGGGTLGMSIDALIFGDFFTVDDQRVMAGYVFELGERFSIVPAIGVSFWSLDVEDVNNVFIAGSQRTELEDSGTDLLLRISAEFRAGRRLRLYASYVETNVDFGDYSYPSIGFKFQF